MRIKEYLSYSQYSTYMSSPEAYIKGYIEGRKFGSKYLDFGKVIADALETDNISELDKIANIEVLKKLPLVDENEKELLVNFNGVPLHGKLDGYKYLEIHEYKTGKNPWTQKKVDEAIQLTFYAIMISLLEKKNIEDIEILLHWIETFEDTDGRVHFTGRLETYETKRTNTDMIKIYPKIKRTWEGIEDLINNYIKK